MTAVTRQSTTDLIGAILLHFISVRGNDGADDGAKTRAKTLEKMLKSLNKTRKIC